jgi:hypothetical protein
MNYFASHGYLALVLLALFPRLTLLFGAFATGGVLWWLGWVFAPHFLVAVLAIPYWHTNPVLVIVAWVVALAGTGGEGSAARRARRR